MLVVSAINVPCAWTDPSPQDEDYKYSYGYYTNFFFVITLEPRVECYSNLRA